MTTITIPKIIAQDKELIAVPRNAYEEFLVWQRKIKSRREFTPSVTEKKALTRARKNFSRGKFTTLKQLEHELGIDY